MPGFTVSKDKLTLLVRDNAGSDFKLKAMLIYHLKILGPLRMIRNQLCLCSVNGTTKPG